MNRLDPREPSSAQAAAVDPAIDRRLDALNFFLADVRGGLGAFVSVFLVSAAGWRPDQIGWVLTASGLIGIAFHVPIGALIDSIATKRLLIVVAVGLLAVCAVAIERAPTGPVVFAADVTMAMLGGVFAPTIAAMTLGLARDRDLPRRFARNAVFDRIGNIAIAAVVGVVGWWWSQRTTFYLVPLFAVVSAWVALTIPASAIDPERARGFSTATTGVAPEPVLRLLTRNRALLILAIIATTFHLANAAMLPLIGQKLALSHPGYESALMSACILVAQLVTLPVAYLVGARADAIGYRWLLGAACLALVGRGLIFAVFDHPAVLVAAQVLDGAAAGLWDVLLPLILADLVAGSGRYSMSRGIVGTVQGIGGSISNAVGGGIAAASGYAAAFAVLALIAAIAAALVAQLPDRASPVVAAGEAV